MGGGRREDTNNPVNLVAICGSATTACHGWVESHPDESRAYGWRVDQGQNPAETPILHWQYGFVLLTEDGGYIESDKAA